MRLFGSLKELVSAVFRKDTREITLEPNSGTYTGNVTVQLPNQLATGTTVLVGEATSQSLTNKTIDADSNTITNIDNADIKVGAAIDRTKLANGTNNHVIINNGSGALSSEAQLAKSRGGAGADMTNVTFPATGVLVTRDALESLSNKTLDSTNLLNTARLQNAQVRMQGTAGGVSSLEFYEDNNIGTNKVSIKAPASLGADYSITLPSDGGNSNASVLATTSGDGVTSWIRYASTNTNSTLVQRDVSGNFSAGTITATLNGNATNVTGTVAIANGGTGQTTQQAALTALAGTQASGQYLRSNGTNTLLSAIQDADLPASMAGKTLTASAISSDPATTVGVGALKLPTGNSTTDRPTGTASQLKGMVRYNDTDDVFEGYNELSGWSSIGGGGTTDRVTQGSHGFVVGDTLYLNGSTYTKAIATSAAAAEVVGVVSRVIDSSTFELTLSGEVSGLSGLITGEVYFLSAATAGGLTATEPSVIGQVSVPVGVASSASTLYVAPKRGIVVGGTNARTELSFTNVTTAQNIQNFSDYEAGEITGWVYIDATADLRFYVAAQFSRGGNGNYNLSYQTSGDTPPAGFSVSITNAGQMQITLSSGGVAGFSSAKFNYALNAPALGASFPLSLDSTNIGIIRAKDSTGLVFQENDGTTTGTVSDTGAWTLGASTGSINHTLQGGTTGIIANSNTASSGVEFRFQRQAVNKFAFGVNDAGPGGADGAYFYSYAGSLYAGGVSSAGAWTLGPSDGSATHTVKGKVWHGKSTNIWLDSNLTQTLAAGALNNILTTSDAGLLCAYDSNSGSTALFLIAGTSITKIADPKNNWNTADATNINRLYISGSNYNLKNAGASSNTYRLFFMSFEGTL